MAIEHHFYVDTSATRHQLRDTLAQADIGLVADEDFEDTSGAYSEATNVTLVDENIHERAGLSDNGVFPTRVVSFRDRRLYMSKPDAAQDFLTQTIQGVVALLKAFPDANAYLEGWDARVPLLARLNGRLILSQEQTALGEVWDGKQHYRALIDLPYTIEPLGPWKYIPFKEGALARHEAC